MYLGAAAAVVLLATLVGPRLAHLTGGSPITAPRSPLPVGTEAGPSANPVARAVGGGTPTPVTASSP